MTRNWKPLPLPEVQSLFADFGAPWWVAGGLAIELAVGTRVRQHRDLDVLILRRDQNRLREIMNAYDLYAADLGGASLRPWAEGETLNAPINGLWCRRRDDASWLLEILLDEAHGENWVSRRCAAVNRAVASLSWFTPDLVPVLAPEIVLCYKAKDPRLEDECDFAAMLPHLTAAQSRWLDDALAAMYASHPWRRSLQR